HASPRTSKVSTLQTKASRVRVYAANSFSLQTSSSAIPLPDWLFWKAASSLPTSSWLMVATSVASVRSGTGRERLSPHRPEEDTLILPTTPEVRLARERTERVAAQR